jgi:hypothetical protein
MTVMATEQSTATSEPSRRQSAAHEKPLRESLDDASVLLWYATREGKPVSKETVEHIVAAQAMLSARSRDPEVEGQFWIAFRDLATAIRPVSVDSILATYSYPFGDHGRPDDRRSGWRAWWFGTSGRRRLVDAATTKKRYSVCSIIVLVCLLIVQIYWFIGTTFRTDLETHRAELDRIAGTLREMAPAVKAAQTMVSLKEEQLGSIKEPTAAGPLNAVSDSAGEERDLEPMSTDLEAMKKEQSRLILAYANVTRRGSRVILMLQGNSAMLAWWDVFTDLAGLADHAVESTGAPAQGMQPIAAVPLISKPDDAAATYYANFAQELDPDRDLQDDIVQIENALVNDQLKVEISLLNSKSTLDILSQYVLPLLYGLLGSLAYILRTLSREIHNVTFTRGSEIRYSLRWPLGMLGGVTVGLFFDTAELTGFAAITPLGLAFLAGYGVELLFTGLDRMVSAFTGESAAERSRPA